MPSSGSPFCYYIKICNSLNLFSLFFILILLLLMLCIKVKREIHMRIIKESFSEMERHDDMEDRKGQDCRINLNLDIDLLERERERTTYLQ